MNQSEHYGERALAFAAECDPQPFHLDEAAAHRSIFGGLTANGWHTAAVRLPPTRRPTASP
jgi:acyl dehydratase